MDLDPNGRVSILKYPPYQKTTVEDLIQTNACLRTQNPHSRWESVWDEIRDLEFDESWLKTQRQSHSIPNYKEVFMLND